MECFEAFLVLFNSTAVLEDLMLTLDVGMINSIFSARPPCGSGDESSDEYTTGLELSTLVLEPVDELSKRRAIIKNWIMITATSTVVFQL